MSAKISYPSQKKILPLDHIPQEHAFLYNGKVYFILPTAAGDRGFDENSVIVICEGAPCFETFNCELEVEDLGAAHLTLSL